MGFKLENIEMWEHHGVDGYEAWDGDDQTRGLGLPGDSEDVATENAAPVTVRLRRRARHRRPGA